MSFERPTLRVARRSYHRMVIWSQPGAPNTDLLESAYRRRTELMVSPVSLENRLPFATAFVLMRGREMDDAGDRNSSPSLHIRPLYYGAGYNNDFPSVHSVEFSVANKVIRLAMPRRSFPISSRLPKLRKRWLLAAFIGGIARV